VVKNWLNIPEFVLSLIEFYADNFYHYKEYVAEIHGIADGGEISFGYIFLANYFYEVSTACSGILIRNEAGYIMHGRNLDFPFQKYLSKLSAKVLIFKGDNYIATFDQVIGYVFVLTGSKKN
jgi:hypothetical protein